MDYLCRGTPAALSDHSIDLAGPESWFLSLFKRKKWYVTEGNTVEQLPVSFKGRQETVHQSCSDMFIIVLFSSVSYVRRGQGKKNTQRRNYYSQIWFLMLQALPFTLSYSFLSVSFVINNLCY